jgi:hypothetical protein
MTHFDGIPVEEIGAIPLPESYQKRGIIDPVPKSLDKWLNEAQTLSLRTMEYFGWQLWFIRRQEPAVVVIRDTFSNQFAVLEPGGQVNQASSIRLRVEA